MPEKKTTAGHADLSLEYLFSRNDYYVFLVSNETRTHLQSGLAGSLKVQIAQWEKAAYFLTEQGRQDEDFCIHLLYWECFPDVSQALVREKEISKMSFRKKQDLVSFANPEWRSLNKEVGYSYDPGI